MSRIKGFDGVRGIGVLFVVATHLHVIEPRHSRGWLDVFFVLSGFLITHLLVRELDRHGRISLRDFFIRRALRILPLYFMVLAVEEHFYLVWPLVFVALAGRRRGHLRLLVLLVAFVSASLLAWQWILDHTSLHGAYYVDRWSMFAGIAIATGCGLALLLRAAPECGRWMRPRVVLPPSLALALLPAWCSFGDPLDAAARSIGVGLVVAWIFLNQESHLVRGLEWRPFVELGTVSYGIYMYHGLFISTGPDRFLGQKWPPDPWVGLVLTLWITPLSYHAFERPMLELKRRFVRE